MINSSFYKRNSSHLDGSSWRPMSLSQSICLQRRKEDIWPCLCRKNIIDMDRFAPADSTGLWNTASFLFLLISWLKNYTHFHMDDVCIFYSPCTDTHLLVVSLACYWGRHQGTPSLPTRDRSSPTLTARAISSRTKPSLPQEHTYLENEFLIADDSLGPQFLL